MAMKERSDLAGFAHELEDDAASSNGVATAEHPRHETNTLEQSTLEQSVEQVNPQAQTASGSVEIDPLLCPVEVAARIIGQKWTLQIVKTLLNCKSQRFCELQEALGGVNPSTLSSRLKMLEDEGMIRRVQISAIPPHVEYSLTTMGCELRDVIQEISYWSRDWLCTPERVGSWNEIETDE